MEQIEAHTSRDGQRQMPVYDVPWRMLCRVVNVQLQAERDSDEVFAQVTLLPETETEDCATEKEAEHVKSPSQRVVSFCKILTNSDTSTHGGFSVLKRHADECLPPLDMSQNPPAQELVVKDLHGVEWSFRHIYRGQPKRHLLTTGWSTFLNAKKLVPGDAFIFLRGENGELRVGVRRGMKQQNAAAVSVISAQSMHIGVLASAAHALTTGTMFSVYYRPRTGPAEFIVPCNQYMESIKNNYSIGMRFRMRFEGEDGQEERCTGTLTCIEDAEPIAWPDSKWKCFKIQWDEVSTIKRPERVSPWELIPLVPAAGNPSVLSRPKRQRAAHLPSPLETSASHRDVSLIKHNPSHLPPVSLLRSTETANICHQVLQGQEKLARGSSPFSVDCNGPGNPHKLPSQWACPPFTDPEGGNDIVDNQRHKGDKWSHSVRVEPHQGHSSRIQENPWLASPRLHDPPTSDTVSMPHVKQGWFQESEVNMKHKGIMENQMFQPIAPNEIQEVEFPKPKETVDQMTYQPIKLFGVNLVENPMGPMSPRVATSDEVYKPSLEPFLEQSRTIKPSESGASGSVNEYSSVTNPVANTVTARSCTKVHKKGCVLGRSVDLSKFDGYEELIDELDKMFEFEGALLNRSKGWKVIYTDHEGDTMMVGDYPWPEFCSMVRKLYIYPQEEVHKLKPLLQNAKGLDFLS